MITLTPPQRTQANHDGKPVTGNYSTMHQILDEHLPLTLTDFTFLPILIRFIRSRRLFFPSLGALPVPSGTGSLSLSIIGLVCSSSDIVKIQRMKTSQRSNCTAAFVLHKIRTSASFSPEFYFFCHFLMVTARLCLQILNVPKKPKCHIIWIWIQICRSPVNLPLHINNNFKALDPAKKN